jgi:hypothetical protein
MITVIPERCCGTTGFACEKATAVPQQFGNERGNMPFAGAGSLGRVLRRQFTISLEASKPKAAELAFMSCVIDIITTRIWTLLKFFRLITPHPP